MHRTKYLQTGCTDQGQSITSHGRESSFARVSKLASFKTEENLLANHVKNTLLSSYFKSPIRQRPHFERIPAFLSLPQRELESNSKMRWMAGGTPPDFVQSAALADCVVQGAGQRIAN